MDIYNPKVVSEGAQQTLPTIVSSSRAAAILVLVLVIAALLRLNFITQPFIDAFSWPQTMTAMMADNFYYRQPHILYPQTNWNGPNPSYQGRDLQLVSFIAAMFYETVGKSEAVSRAVVIAFGLWSIFALYKLVGLVWDEDRALVSAAVLAVLPGAVFIDRSFLPEPAMLALVLTSLWLLVGFLQTDSWFYLLPATILGALGIMTRLPAILIGLAVIYAVLSILQQRHKLSQRRLVSLAVAGLLSLIAFGLYYIWVRRLALSYPPRTFIGFGSWLWKDGLTAWLQEQFFAGRFGEHVLGWLWTIPGLALVGLGLGITPGKRVNHHQAGQTERPGAPWFFHLWLLGGLIYYLLDAKELVQAPWSLHILNPAAAALAGHAIVSLVLILSSRFQKTTSGLAMLLQPTRLLFLSLAIVVLIFGLVGRSALQNLYTPPHGDESHQLGLTLNSIADPGELIITMASEFDNPDSLYYSQRRGWIFPPVRGDMTQITLPNDDEAVISEFDALREQGADWLGMTNRRRQAVQASHPRFISYIETTAERHLETPAYIIYRLFSPEEVRPIYLSQEIHYLAPEAGEVFLLWGIDDWQATPPAHRPSGTMIRDGMVTPMQRQGDKFVAAVSVPVGAVFNYAFLTTRNHAGARVEDIREDVTDYPIIRTSEIIEVTAVANPMAPVTMEQEFHYHVSHATEVILVWTLNDDQLPPEAIRPPDSEVIEAALHTPMLPVEAGYRLNIAAPAGTIIHYGFLVTEARQGVTVNTWWDSRPDYQVTVSEESAVTIDAAESLKDAQTIFDLTDMILTPDKKSD